MTFPSNLTPQSTCADGKAINHHDSEVYKGFSKITRQPVAIKIIDLENAEDEIDDIQQEIAILSQLDSDFVTK